MVNREYEVWDIAGGEEPNWLRFRRFGVSYKKAFLALIECQVEEARLGRNYDDEDILPALMALHHYVELCLKSLLIKLNVGASGHDIRELLKLVETNYPEFKLTKLSRLLITDRDLINDRRYLLDHEAFRYPADLSGNQIWIRNGPLGSFIMLDGVYKSGANLIKEIEDYFLNKVQITSS